MEWSDVQGSNGTLFGPWHAVQSLSRGGASEVYLARHRDDGSLAAVKAFHAAADGDGERIRRSREIRLLAEVDHPRVVRILDSRSGAVWPERDYIVTEYVAGADVAMLLRSGPLSLESARTLVAAAAEALTCLHRMGIIHRDVKPANLFVPIAGEQDPDYAAAKLGDLGIAIEVDATRVTSNGLAVGTANYLSPEQVSGDAITPATDIYSLGLVLLECLSGERAYGGAGVEAALARLHRPPDIPASIPRPARRLLRDMLATAPERRPAAIDVVRRLAALGEPGARCAASDLRTRPMRRAMRTAGPGARRPGRAARLAGSLSAAAVLALMGVLWTGSSASPTGAPPPREAGQTAVSGQTARDDAAAPQQDVPVVAVDPGSASTSPDPSQAAAPAESAGADATEDAAADQAPADDASDTNAAPVPPHQGPPADADAPGKTKAPPGQLKKQAK